MMITLDRVLAAAEKRAEELSRPMNIAVVDAGGNLVAHVRMDGAWIGSIEIATQDLAAYSQSGGPFFGIHTSNNGRVMIFPGGIPLMRDGKVVGAIGVSGGMGEQDQAVAEAAAAVF
jgi:uncharacterized protein GlcG (DUF336 family)